VSSGERAKRIHIVNPMADPTGGSEWRAASLYRELSGVAATTLWRRKEGSSGPFGIPSRAMSLPRGQFPRAGTIVFVGVYFGMGSWIWLARPRRVVLVYNTPDRERLDWSVRRIRRTCGLEPEIVFCSQSLADSVPHAGVVEPSIVDVDRFAPVERDDGRRFTVGRLSRATADKHHPRDLGFYHRLIDAGVEVDVLGATEEMREAGERAGLHLRAAGSVPAEQHLGGLDCFFYRTSPGWSEPWGRVVIEAMASGLPVLIERRTGASSAIDDGRNGFIYDGEDEAFEIIMRLREDRALRQSAGEAARETAVQIMSVEARRAIHDFYLR
jgi:glycosyltransferase involved in cell wall biosynthesis